VTTGGQTGSSIKLTSMPFVVWLEPTLTIVALADEDAPGYHKDVYSPEGSTTRTR